MAFSFGSSTATQAPAQQNSLFSSAPKPANTFSGFGATPAAPSNSSTRLFGQPQNQTQNQQQQPNAGQPSTSLFGGSQQQQPQSGGLFGASTSGTGGGGLFGSANQPQQQQQQQQSGGGLFGSTSNTNQAGSGGGLFGSTNTASQQQQPSGGLFGSTTQPGQQQQGGGLFGSTAQPQQQQGGLFPSTTGGNSLFGGNNAMAGSSGQPQQQGAGGLGQSTLWKSTVGGGVPEPDIETRMTNVKNAWDPASQEYRFKTFVYNVVDQGTTHQYGRQGFSDELWGMATRENPDPTTRVPVVVNGPQDLQKRRQKQIEMAAMQQHISKEISSALRHTRQKAWATDARTRNLQARQTQLHDRLSRLVFQIDQALPPEGSSDASTTADIISKLEGSKVELDGGSLKARGAKESLRAQVNTLRGRIAELRRYPIRQDSGDVGWLGDPEAQAQVAEILTQHQVALEGLTGVLNNMEFEEGVIAKGLTDMGEARH